MTLRTALVALIAVAACGAEDADPWDDPVQAKGDMANLPEKTLDGSGLEKVGEEGILVLDLDGDGDKHTGWVVFYLHIAARDRVPVGTLVKAGDFLGYPSCEGGRSTGTHIHIARKYNGEWMVADGVIPFVLSGWRPERGNEPYEGWLIKGDMRVLASDNPVCNHVGLGPFLLPRSAATAQL